MEKEKEVGGRKMPYKTWGCSICGKQCPKKYREHGQWIKRMAWLREHYEGNHPAEFKEMMKRAKARRQLRVKVKSSMAKTPRKTTKRVGKILQ